MRFEIDFNSSDINNERWFIDNFGGVLVNTGATKYPPFEIVMVEVEDFDKLKNLLDKINKSFDCISSSVVSFDPPSIFIDL